MAWFDICRDSRSPTNFNEKSMIEVDHENRIEDRVEASIPDQDPIGNL